MNAPSKDIAELLSQTGFGALGTVGVDLFYAYEPAEPAQVISVIDTGGFDADANKSYDRPTVQILTRATSYDAAYALAETAKLNLNGTQEITINGARYIGIWSQGDIISLGKDANSWHGFSLNFRLHRTAI
jgi:hypothetical protein